MQHSCGSAQSQTPPVLTSSPGSVRACSSKVEFNLAAIPPHLCRGEPRQKCSGRPEGSRPGCWRSGCIKDEGMRRFSRKHPLRGSARISEVASCFYSAESACSRGRLYPARTFYRTHKVGRSGPGRGDRLPTAPCRSLAGSGSLRSPSPCTAKARPTPRARPPPRPRSASLRALWHCRTLRCRRTGRPSHQG